MRILLCTSETGENAGGLALHCIQLKEIFESMGHEVCIEVLLNPMSYHVLDGGYDPELGTRIRSSYMLKILINKYADKIDLCVSCGGGRTAYYSMLFCKERAIPLYVVLCGSEVNLSYEKPELAFYNTESLGYASAVIGLSNELNQNAKRMSKNPSCRYYVIPNYSDLKQVPAETESKKDKNRVIFASGASYLGEKKGIANLIRAFFDLIHRKGRDDLLFLYGRIDDDIKVQYRRMIRDLSLEQNIIICGYLDRKAFHDKMMEVDTYIQASPFEGFGNSVSEALSLGKDILISDTGYIAESISSDYPDHVMKSLEPEDMANDIFHYCTNVFMRKDAAAIRLKLAEALDKKTIIEKWHQVLGNSVNVEVSVGADSCIAVMFHDVESDYSGIDYSPEGFEDIVRKISERGLKLCSAQEFFRNPQSNCQIICTFDDGYEGVYRNAFPVMKKYSFTATVFICPDLIGKENTWNHKDTTVRRHMSVEMLAKLRNSGWEIGSHGLSHNNLLRLSEHELDECLGMSKSLLADYGSIESFCYPYGQFNLFIKNKVRNYYRNAFSVDIGGNNYVNDMYQITRLTPEQLIKRLEL